MVKTVNNCARYVVFALSTVIGLTGFAVSSQAIQLTAPVTGQSTVERATSGDAPDDPGPVASDLSPELTHAAIAKVARKVADWQLARSQPTFNQQWTYA